MEEQHTEKITGVRLAKFLAAAGIASRRNCEQLIIEGRVTVNGRPVTTPAHNVDPEHDQVSFEGRPVESLANGKRVYILLNKPSGYTCSAKDRHADQLVYSLVPPRYGRLFSVGRLDRDSEGLLILTNDGDFAQKLTHPTQRVTKRYYVECRAHEQIVRELRAGDVKPVYYLMGDTNSPEGGRNSQIGANGDLRLPE